MIKGIEIPLREAIRRFPRILPVLLQMGVDITDNRYVVRFNEDGYFEIGYPEDEWKIAA